MIKNSNGKVRAVNKDIKSILQSRKDLMGARVIFHDMVSASLEKWLIAHAKRHKYNLFLFGKGPQWTIITEEDDRNEALQRKLEYEAEQDRLSCPG